MKVLIVNSSDIAKHPTMRMDAEYHIGKSQGKKAYKQLVGGMLEEDDISGKIMMTPDDANEYNTILSEKLILDNRLKNLLK